MQKWELLRKFPFLPLTLSTLCRQREVGSVMIRPGSIQAPKHVILSEAKSKDLKTAKWRRLKSFADAIIRTSWQLAAKKFYALWEDDKYCRLPALCRQLDQVSSAPLFSMVAMELNQRSSARHSMEQSSTGFARMSLVSGVSVTAVRARTIFPAGTECVSHTLPPMMQSLPIRVSPPRTVAPA